MRRFRSDHHRHESDTQARLRRLSEQVPRPLSRRLARDAENEKLRGHVGVRVSWIH